MRRFETVKRKPCVLCRIHGVTNLGDYQCADCNGWYCQPHANQHFSRWPETVKQAQERAETAEREKKDLSAKLHALEIMLTSETWGAAYGAVCEDYPDLLALVNKHMEISRRGSK